MLPMLAGVLSTLVANKLPKVAEAVIDKGIDYVEDKIGIELKPDMTPEEIQKVREAAMKHEEFMTELEVKNTTDARDMQKVALQQSDVFSKRFVYYFAAFWSIVASVFIFGITFGTIPPENVRFADMISGFLLGTVIATILNFFYGSSFGSSKKTDILADKGE